jgi:hypothetical protein
MIKFKEKEIRDVEIFEYSETGTGAISEHALSENETSVTVKFYGAFNYGITGIEMITSTGSYLIGKKKDPLFSELSLIGEVKQIRTRIYKNVNIREIEFYDSTGKKTSGSVDGNKKLKTAWKDFPLKEGERWVGFKAELLQAGAHFKFFSMIVETIKYLD